MKEKRLRIRTREKEMCNICGREISKEYRKQHISVLHEGKKSFKCSTCPEAFSEKRKLVQHIELVNVEKKGRRKFVKRPLNVSSAMSC